MHALSIHCSLRRDGHVTDQPEFSAIASGVLAPGPLAAALEETYGRLERARFVDALWSRRLDVWSADLSIQQQIGNRLGWLDAPAWVTSQMSGALALAASVRDDDISDIVLLGMGGSSLAPEVLRAVIGAATGYPRFRVLDSVDPESVNAAMARVTTSLFVLASKSGSTIEPATLAAEAERRIRDAGVTTPGRHFVAITDEGTALHHRARDKGFREVFLNPSDIGGRYSALSLFGMVPAALMGIDVSAVLTSARAMADACRHTNPRHNPGVALGAVMATAALSGRDKLTVVLPSTLEPFGLWIEQLVAESTGKDGKGIIPVFGENAQIPMGRDRVIVQLFLDGGPRPLATGPGATSGTPALTIDIPQPTFLGAEFFRWEIATATAGWLLGVNPFDEPNVQQAKNATRVLLDRYGTDGCLPTRDPDAAIDGVSLTLTDAARRLTHPLALLQLVQPSDYVAVLAYLPQEVDAFTRELAALRDAIGSRASVATTLGYGPRFLHSTGQLHKGGGNTGVFILVTAEVTADVPIPGERHSFGILQLAQATGDFESLNQTGRRALHVHLARRDPELLRHVCQLILAGG